MFDRTKDGRILQRNFGGHRYPRLAHVGDRTGLEMIRTLQDHGVHRGIDVYMEHTVVALLTDSGRVSGALAYDRERGRFKVFRAKAIVMATGGLGRAFRITSNSWEYTGDGYALAYDAGAALQDLEFIQFHPTGMVWPPSVQRHPRHRRRARRGRRPAEQGGPPVHVRRHPGQLQEPDGQGRRRRLALHAGRQDRQPSARAADARPRRALHQPRGEGRPRIPHGGVFLDIAWIKKHMPNAADHIKRKLPSMYHQFKQLANLDITTTPMEVGPTTHYTMGGIRVDGDTQMSTRAGPLRRRRSGRRACTAPTGSAATRCRT